jgi:2-oxoglutarate dehydrogenase E2 component (dihydrolipoamide succinyltransferase)
MIDVVMPQLGESVTEGTVVSWRKRIGEDVAQDEYLCDVTTDKVTFEVPSPAAGTLESVLARDGETVAVGSVIARLATAVATEALPATLDHALASAGATLVPSPEPAGARALRPSPLARRLARDAGIETALLKGSGRNGRVRSADVLAAIRENASRPPDAAAPGQIAASSPTAQPASGDEIIPFSPVRRQIAEHMVRSVHTSPHGFIAFEVDYTAVERARATVREPFRQREGFGLTYLPFVMFALAQAVRAFPLVNSSIEGERLIVHRAINLNVAIDLSYRGLVTPVVRNADSLNVTGLARAVSDLARRARENRLAPADLAGGTFTVTNPGPSGTLLSVPIINQPQTAILVTDGVARRPAVVVSADGGEALAIRSLGYIGLSLDHRAFDGAYAADFLKHMTAVLENTNWATRL